MQEGTAVEVQWPSGARAMGYSFIGSYQSASGALPLCDRRPSGASGLKCASFQVAFIFAWAALMLKFCKNLAGPCPAPT